MNYTDLRMNVLSQEIGPSKRRDPVIGDRYCGSKIGTISYGVHCKINPGYDMFVTATGYQHNRYTQCNITSTTEKYKISGELSDEVKLKDEYNY